MTTKESKEVKIPAGAMARLTAIRAEIERLTRHANDIIGAVAETGGLSGEIEVNGDTISEREG